MMMVIWRYGYLTSKEISEHMNLPYGRVNPLVRSLVQAGVIYRRRVGDVFVYSIDNYWATHDPDILAMLEAVEEAKSEGFDPTVKQL